MLSVSPTHCGLGVVKSDCLYYHLSTFLFYLSLLFIEESCTVSFCCLLPFSGKMTGWIVTQTGEVCLGLSDLKDRLWENAGDSLGSLAVEFRETASQPLVLLKL